MKFLLSDIFSNTITFNRKSKALSYTLVMLNLYSMIINKGKTEVSHTFRSKRNYVAYL